MYFWAGVRGSAVSKSNAYANINQIEKLKASQKKKAAVAAAPAPAPAAAQPTVDNSEKIAQLHAEMIKCANNDQYMKAMELQKEVEQKGLFGCKIM